MNEQASEQQSDVVRVAGLGARQTNDGFEYKGMDLQGFGMLGEVLPEGNRSVAFAVAASMLATGVPMYYSYKAHAISTDATFGTTPSKVPDFTKTGPLRVMRIDGIWMFATSQGRLVLTLEDGPLEQINIDDANAFIGWLHMTDIDEVILNDGVLATVTRRVWEQDSLVNRPWAPLGQSSTNSRP